MKILLRVLLIFWEPLPLVQNWHLGLLEFVNWKSFGFILKNGRSNMAIKSYSLWSFFLANTSQNSNSLGTFNFVDC